MRPSEAATTRSGWSRSMNLKAARRHGGQSGAGAPRTVTGTSGRGHADLVMEYSFQLSLSAIASSAGSHCTACESPMSTTLNSSSLSPSTHGVGVRSPFSAWHPPWYALGLMRDASSRDGTRSDGSRRRSSAPDGSDGPGDGESSATAGAPRVQDAAMPRSSAGSRRNEGARVSGDAITGLGPAGPSLARSRASRWPTGDRRRG